MGVLNCHECMKKDLFGRNEIIVDKKVLKEIPESPFNSPKNSKFDDNTINLNANKSYLFIEKKNSILDSYTDDKKTLQEDQQKIIEYQKNKILEQQKLIQEYEHQQKLLLEQQEKNLIDKEKILRKEIEQLNKGINDLNEGEMEGGEFPEDGIIETEYNQELNLNHRKNTQNSLSTYKFGNIYEQINPPYYETETYEITDTNQDKKNEKVIEENSKKKETKNARENKKKADTNMNENKGKKSNNLHTRYPTDSVKGNSVAETKKKGKEPLDSPSYGDRRRTKKGDIPIQPNNKEKFRKGIYNGITSIKIINKGNNNFQHYSPKTSLTKKNSKMEKNNEIIYDKKTYQPKDAKKI